MSGKTGCPGCDALWEEGGVMTTPVMGRWSRATAEDWVDTAERLAFHPATPAEVRDVLMKYVRGTRQQFRVADLVTNAPPTPEIEISTIIQEGG